MTHTKRKYVTICYCFLDIITKNWSKLLISPTVQKLFYKKPVVTYKWNKILGNITGYSTLQWGTVFFKTHFQIVNGESKSCNTTNKASWCCTQVVNTKPFASSQSNSTFKILHKLSCYCILSPTNYFTYIKYGISIKFWFKFQTSSARRHNWRRVLCIWKLLS